MSGPGARAEEIEAAEALLQRAIDIDPDYPRANSLLAWSLAARVQLGLRRCREARCATPARWRSGRSSAIPKTPGRILPPATFTWSRAASRQAVAELTEAIELNPSLAFAHMILGSTYGYGGMPDDGLHHCAPRDQAQSPRLSSSRRPWRPPDFVTSWPGGSRMRSRSSVAPSSCARTSEWRWRTLASAAGLAGDLERRHECAFRGATVPPPAVGRVGRQIPRHRPYEEPRNVHRRTARRGPFVRRPARVTAPPGLTSGRRRWRRGRRPASIARLRWTSAIEPPTEL